MIARFPFLGDDLGINLADPVIAAQYGDGSAPQAVPPQVPSGSQLLYTATVHVSLLGTLTPSGIEADLHNALGPYGMAVVSSSESGTFTEAFTFGIQVTGNGFALRGDAQSILDSLLNGITGNNVLSSHLDLVSSPGGVIPPGFVPQDLTTFLEANWGYIAAAAIAMVAIPTVARLVRQ